MHLHLGTRRLSYTTTGHGSTPVLLVPGGPGFTRDYLHTIHQSLPENEFTVISYNSSGSAGNENAPFYKSVAAFAREAKEVLEALNLKDVFILGHSWGTAVVQEFLAQYPDVKVRGIVLVNGFSNGVQLAESIKKRMLELPPVFHENRKRLLAIGDFDSLDALIGEHWFPRFVCRLPLMPDQLLKSLAPLHETAMYHYYIGHDVFNINGAIVSWNRTHELAEIKVPALIMSGEFDYGSRSDFDNLINAIPNATEWYEPGVSHFPMYEKPNSFRDALLKFLRSNL